MEILSRNTKKVDNKYHICNRDIYYKNGDQYNISDPSFQETNSKIGKICLTDKNVFSVGVRTDKDLNKLIGLRPDDDQTGSKQIEFSINNIEYDGIDIDLDLSDHKISENKVDLGSLQILSNPGVFSQFYRSEDIKDFVIDLNLDLTGYTIQNSQFKEEKTTRKGISLEVFNIGENTTNNTLKYISSNNIKDTEDQKLSFIIGKITDKNIMLGEYSKEDQFTDPDLTGYTTSITPHSSTIEAPRGGSTYMENTIAVYCKGQNIYDDHFEDIILTNICEKYNLTLLKQEDESDIGEYFLYNDMKVGSWYVMEDHQFVAYFNTQEIPDHVKSLFKSKTFDQTSFLDLSLDQVIQDFEDQFDHSTTEISINTDCYEPEAGRFIIQDSDGRKIYMDIPIVLDHNFEPIPVQTGHKLIKTGDNKYKYTKYIDPQSAMLLKMKGVCYIDPTLDVSSKRFDVAKTGSTTHSVARNSGSYSSGSNFGTCVSIGEPPP